jgi:hypothetical protein
MLGRTSRQAVTVCSKGKSSGSVTATEVTIARDDQTYGPGTQHSTARPAGNISNCSDKNHKFFSTLNHMMLFSPTFCTEMINNTVFLSAMTPVSHVVFIDEA